MAIRTKTATKAHKMALLLLINAEYYKAFKCYLPDKAMTSLIEDVAVAKGKVVLVDDVVVAGYLLEEDSLVTYVIADGYKKSKVWLILTKALFKAVEHYKVIKYKKLSPLMKLNSKICINNKIIIKDFKAALERGIKRWEAQPKP